MLTIIAPFPKSRNYPFGFEQETVEGVISSGLR